MSEGRIFLRLKAKTYHFINVLPQVNELVKNQNYVTPAKSVAQRREGGESIII